MYTTQESLKIDSTHKKGVGGMQRCSVLFCLIIICWPRTLCTNIHLKIRSHNGVALKRDCVTNIKYLPVYMYMYIINMRGMCQGYEAGCILKLTFL